MRLEFVAAVRWRRQGGERCLADIGHRAGAKQGHRLHEAGDLLRGDYKAVVAQQSAEAEQGRGGGRYAHLAPFTERGCRQAGEGRRHLLPLMAPPLIRPFGAPSPRERSEGIVELPAHASASSTMRPSSGAM